jgi:predicted Zn-dependent protease
MLRFGLARAQIATNDAGQNRAAIDHLRTVVDRDRDSTGAWQQLAVAYGRDGQLGLSALSSAEFNIRVGRKRDAKHHAGGASRLLAQGSPGWLRAQDIEFTAGKKRK